ncbi:hypothetical protein J40TS1_37880 [Paenibacillus montaniterrae]|uniref:Uncharacterized protein n=1 Tax=Paenibacillus montaniterrae TaxID=429341 RepID=A0A919YVR9_9BACL|nr:hypothetical protein [Paenibacillus montaniterrae]GIP18146.1 hypothetical protein J40TS1_37880 [Paenibacillus montaniterrae]
MKSLIQRLILVLIVIIGLFLFWDSYRSTTIEVVFVEKISKNEMSVINLSGRERTIVVPLDLTDIIEVNKRYTVSYDKRILDNFKLRKIYANSE